MADLVRDFFVNNGINSFLILVVQRFAWLGYDCNIKFIGRNEPTVSGGGMEEQ